MDNRKMYSPYRPVCSGGGCAGSNGQMNGGSNNGCNCHSLLERIRETDFAILDATLYLDVYPGCTDAINYIAAKNKERRELVDKYEPMCGPLTIYGIQSGVNTDPWPWQYRGS